MLYAFDVDDEVLILCDDEEDPLYVVGFVSDPKACFGFVYAIQEKLEMEDLGTYAFKMSGVFKLLAPGGVEMNVTQSNSKDLVLTLTSSASGTVFRVNGVEITDGEWTYGNWYEDTGPPATWEIEPPDGRLFSVTPGSGYDTHVITVTTDDYEYDLSALNFPHLSYVDQEFWWVQGEGGDPGEQIYRATFPSADGQFIYANGRIKGGDVFSEDFNGAMDPVDRDAVVEKGITDAVYFPEDCYNFNPRKYWRDGSYYENDVHDPYSFDLTDQTTRQWYSRYQSAEYVFNSGALISSLGEPSFEVIIGDEDGEPALCVYDTTAALSNGNTRPGDFDFRQKIEGSSLESLFETYDLELRDDSVEVDLGDDIDSELM